MDTDPPLLFCEDRVEELVDNHHESLGGVLYTALRMAVDDGAIDLDNLRAIYEKATAEGKIAMDSAIYEVIGFSCKEILEPIADSGRPPGWGAAPKRRVGTRRPRWAGADPPPTPTKLKVLARRDPTQPGQLQRTPGP